MHRDVSNSVFISVPNPLYADICPNPLYGVGYGELEAGGVLSTLPATAAMTEHEYGFLDAATMIEHENGFNSSDYTSIHFDERTAAVFPNAYFNVFGDGYLDVTGGYLDVTSTSEYLDIAIKSGISVQVA